MSDWLQPSAPTARFILQGGPAARAAAGQVFGVILPEKSCRAESAGGRAALWLGPDEHLLLAPIADASNLASGLEAAFTGIAHSLVDVSQRQVGLLLKGPHALAILGSGCPLDLDPTEFPAGMCTRTLFHKADIVLWRTGTSEFHLEVSRSLSDYVGGCLREAALDLINPADIA